MESFNRLVDTILSEFTDLQQQKNDAPDRPWHRKENPKNQTAKNQKSVAGRYEYRFTGDGEKTYRGELNSKIESMRDPSNGKSFEVLQNADIDHILKNYPIDGLDKDKPKQLSNTGLQIRWSRDLDRYILTRHE